MIGMRSRNFFLEILFNNSFIRSLPKSKKRKKINWILKDLEKEGIFDPIDFSNEDELDILADIIFGGINTEEFITDNSISNQVEEKISIDSIKRIRQKRIEFAKDPRSGIILDKTDFLPEDKIVIDKKNKCSYGRTVLHQAIALRDLSSIKRYAKQKKYLIARDNNGNTPYEMAFQQRYKEAMKILQPKCRKK